MTGWKRFLLLVCVVHCPIHELLWTSLTWVLENVCSDMHCCRRGFKITFKCVQPREMNENWNLYNLIWFLTNLKIFGKHTNSLDPISILSPHSFSSFQNKHNIILKIQFEDQNSMYPRVWNKGVLQVQLCKHFRRKIAYIFLSISFTVLGAQKNRLNETILLSTHNICFGWDIRNLFFEYALLSWGLGRPRRQWFNYFLTVNP